MSYSLGPITRCKQRLKQHLKETHNQKSRLRRIIRRLGGKPTDAKADLSLAFVSSTKSMGNNLPKNVNSKKEDYGLENSMPEEYELMQMSRDFAIKHDELVAYDLLMRTMQMTDTPRQHEIISLLEKSMQEEESVIWIIFGHRLSSIKGVCILYQYTSIGHGQNFLLKHTSSKIPLVIIYAGLVGSTNMSMTLPVNNLVTMIRAFAHQISHVADSHGGHVLKYVGK